MKIGDIVLKVTMARFARTLSTLVAAGVDIMKALEITGTTAGNWVVEDALRDMREQVHAGRPDRAAADRASGLPADGRPDGEDRRGDGRARRDAREDRRLLRGGGRRAITALTSIIEPIMIILVGCMVATIILSMYLPMFKLLTLIK